MSNGRRPVIEFDHHAPEFGQDQMAKFVDLRIRCPVAYTDSYEGFWVASTYDLAREVISDQDSFTVEKSADGTKGGKLIPTSRYAPSILPGLLEGEAHDRLRRPLKALFARGAVEDKVAPIARRVAAALVAELRDREEFDFAGEFSFRMTVETICDFVGLHEVGDRTKFILMLEDAFAIDPEAGADRDALASSAARQFEEASDLVRGVVRARAGEPADDLISHMVAPETGLTEDEVVSLALSMVLGGVRTTASSLDHIVLYLDAHPVLRERLRDEPSLIANAVDELVRIASVTPLVARTARRDVRLGDVEVRQGDRVAALIASANLDGERFADPETVKLDRRDGLHLAFGAGTHYCLGIWLAKMELRVAVEEILQHLPDLRVVPNGVRPYRIVGVNNGYSRIRVRPQG
jgi:cytochrome P450